MPAPFTPEAIEPLFARWTQPPPSHTHRYAFLDGCLEFAQTKHLHPLCDALDGFLFLRFSFYAAPEQARLPVSCLPPASPPASPPLLAWHRLRITDTPVMPLP